MIASRGYWGMVLVGYVASTHQLHRLSRRTAQGSQEQRLEDLALYHEHEVRDRRGRQEPERRTPGRARDPLTRARWQRHDHVRDDAAGDEHHDDEHGDCERSQIAAWKARATAEGNVVDEVGQTEGGRDREARGHGTDDGPGRVPELPPADLEPRRVPDG